MPNALTLRSGPERPFGAYQEHAPPPTLTRYIECFWSRMGGGDNPGATRSHRVLPDGCVDVVLAFEGGGELSSAMAVGTMTRPVVYADSTRTTYIGTRFRPGVAGVLFGIPAVELTDQRPDLADALPEADVLTDALSDTADGRARVKILSAGIARRLLAAEPVPVTVSAAIARISACRGNLSIDALASELGITRQHLARSFAQHVGVAPKLLARIVRARRVLDHVRGRPDVDWTALAYDAGYYDQSHLIGEVRELTGLVPSAWVAAHG